MSDNRIDALEQRVQTLERRVARVNAAALAMLTINPSAKQSYREQLYAELCAALAPEAPAHE